MNAVVYRKEIAEAQQLYEESLKKARTTEASSLAIKTTGNATTASTIIINIE